MAKTLDALRTALAASVARLFSGTATGGTATTLVDAERLKRYTETDALKGGFLYIADTTDEGAPKGESQRIQSYNAATWTITVDRTFSAIIHAGDTYEIYLAPLTLAQWDQCINDAIRGAWPDVFEPDTEDVHPVGALSYSLSSAADRVLGAEVFFTDALAGYPSQPLLEWYAVGVPGALKLKLSRPVPNSDPVDGPFEIRVLTGKRYDELASGESTTLDPQYVLDAARVQFYQRMADASRQSDRGGFLQLMAHWQEKAAERRRELSAALMGFQQAPKEEK